ncbi:hypothetical protein ACTS9T_15095 [Empedobacter falsenii]|uniref:hypothetical protein n=1 Tax=Empedobacter TaxID=59734 RepID=UPI002578F14F|nr:MULTISPECIES: hypothetical protein [Empedobacter]MDM1043153.1 hypothetical protein [Empedobacter brevis]MDM1137081.1 hypothetical protein [Empedobacter sp. R750]
MARQSGHIKYVGTLGDVRHFKIKGNKGFYAGLKGGPTAQQIASDPAFVRTRENMNEFGGSATTGRSFRTSIANLIRNNADSQVTGRITAVMKKINLEDGSEARGQRAILITAAPQYLEGFEFNKFSSLNGVFNAPYTITSNVDRDESTLAIAPFNPLDNMFIPAGATHFRIINAITVLSDFAYNPLTKSYEPKDNVNNGLTATADSGYLPVNAMTSAISVATTLPGTPTLSADVSVVNILAVEFYQEVNGNYYLFAQGNAMKVVKIF